MAKPRRSRSRAAPRYCFQIEGLERRLLLSSALVRFAAEQTFATGLTPSALVAADLNGDGKADLAVANYYGNSVSVLLGNGNGTFQAQQTFATGREPFKAAVADLNGDGKPDLIATNYLDNSVSVLLGNGNGTFQAQRTFAVGSAPASVVAADVNGDGKLDLIVTNDSTSGTVSILLGNANGTFQAQTTLAVGSHPNPVAVADLNGDGKPDLIVANDGVTTVSVLLGNGNGTFQGQQTVNVGLNPYAMTLADLNGDGKPDVVVGGSVSMVGVLLGNGNGTFQSPQTLATGSGSFSIAVADLNGDGTPDLAVGNITSRTISVLIGNGNGTFLPQQTTAFASNPRALTAADFDGDGVPDLVATQGNVNSVGVLLNRTAVTSVIFHLQQTFGVGPEPYSVAVADLNGDGKPDVVTANGNNSNTVSVLLGNGDGTLQNQLTFATGTNPKSLVIADVNGDSKPDLLYVISGSGMLGVMLGNGNGTVQAQDTFPGGGTGAVGLAVGDLNGDGKLDAVVCTTNSSVGVLLGNGNGTFHSATTVATFFPGYSLALADVNGDGRLDLLVGCGNGDVAVLLGNGNGTFQPERDFTTGAASGVPKSLTVADFNGDGKLDVATANEFNVVSVLLGNGNGAFQSPKTYSAGGFPWGIAAADINGDGKPDLVVAEQDVGIGVLVGLGDGTFYPQQTFAVLHAYSCAVSDLNRDGRPDVVAANFLVGGSVSVLLQDAPPVVTSINRSSPPASQTSSSTLSYAVTFSSAVSNVSPTDFQVITTGSVAASSPVAVSGSGTSYTVTISGVHGSGTLQLALVDHDTIDDAFGVPLGGPGRFNGSFTGQSYWIQQTAPSVVSINRSSPAGPSTSANSVTYAVTFSSNVNGVAPSDFHLVTTGSVTFSDPLVVGGSGSSYTVTISGILGSGTLGLNLVDNGGIHDTAGNPPQNSTPSFNSFHTFAVSNPAVLAAGDLNGDGIPDLLAPNSGSSTVSVLIGNGNGTFSPPQTYAAAVDPYTAQIADVNGDGSPDLLVSSEYGVGIFLANGNGTFQAEHTFYAGVEIVHQPFAVADLNNDGKPDLIVPNGARIGVLLGNGNGTFLPPQTYAAATSELRSVAVADVNGDGAPDLIGVDYQSKLVSVLLGNGNGTFQARETFATGHGARIAPQAVDLNGDGNVDLVTSNLYDNTISVLLGNGNGTFQPQRTYSALGPSAVSVSDVNGDGRLDIVAATASAFSFLDVLLGNGDGTFQAQQQFIASNTNDRSLVLTDVNQDGRPDAVVGYIGSSLSVVTNADNGNFTGQTYSIVFPTLDTITGTAGVDQITLVQDSDHAHIDWTLNGTSDGQLATTDPNGLTINGNGSTDVITLLYTPNSPLPATLHLNGTFTINGLAGTNPLAGTTLEIGKSVVFIAYSASDPMTTILGYIRNGYNAGAWNGTPTPSTGVITSIAAQTNNGYEIGYADSADGIVSGQPANTIELKYTLGGDLNLAGTVIFADFAKVVADYGKPESWDGGAITYGATVSFADFALTVANYGKQAMTTTAATALAAAAFNTASVTAANSPSGSASPPLLPDVEPTGPALPHHPPSARAARKRR